MYFYVSHPEGSTFTDLGTKPSGLPLLRDDSPDFRSLMRLLRSTSQSPIFMRVSVTHHTLLLHLSPLRRNRFGLGNQSLSEECGKEETARALPLVSSPPGIC